MKILLVDDHAIVREGFSTLLSSVLEGAVVTNAKNAQQATNALRANHFDLIILDINLGATSGLTLAEYIVQRWEHAKVLMFSTEIYSNQKTYQITHRWSHKICYSNSFLR